MSFLPSTLPSSKAWTEQAFANMFEIQADAKGTLRKLPQQKKGCFRRGAAATSRDGLKKANGRFEHFGCPSMFWDAKQLL